MTLKSAKTIWDYLKAEYAGDERIRSMQVLNLMREFEIQRMKESETIKEYSDTLLGIANKIKLLGGNFVDSRIVEKILVTVPERYEASIASLENTKDLSKITFAEVLHALLAQEQRRLMREDHAVEGALLAKSQQTNYNKGKGEKKSYPPCQHCGKMGHPPFRCWQRPDAKCIKCNQMRHEAVICKSKNQQQEEEAKVVDQEEEEEDQLFVATCFAGSGESEIKGKGTVAITSCSGTKFIPDVLFVPEIQQNLLSVGQLIEKGFKVLFKNRVCLIHDENGKEIIKAKMRGKSFSFEPIKEEQAAPIKEEEHAAVSTEENVTETWHKRLGHCHLSNMLLMKKELSNDLPTFADYLPTFANCNAFQFGKQNRNSFPKSSWRAFNKLSTQMFIFMKIKSGTGNKHKRHP
ncbi:uncharacterized protein LOC133297245 [Gastrolobium bilobum]|uniref:uncharacterized protein LOC133297245 n=1 Tax=Gastrolobium bilobum TaxID=150636 RepID=UPI002AAFF330|nr:uncharacterized protein LOC133297245 [Gastrolobium bilobum]